MGPGRYTVSRWDLMIGDDMVVWAPDHSHLVGSAISMPKSVENLREIMDIDQDGIDRLTRYNPLKSIGMG